jgi:protein subunit release factor B
MSKPEKKLLFSVTIKDCDVQTFTAGGNGGQNQNRIRSGVRIIHRASGARGEARDTRDQGRNKRAAFVRMAESEVFKKWHKAECSRRLGQTALAEQQTETAMLPHNIKLEVRNDKGLWTAAEPEELN